MNKLQVFHFESRVIRVLKIDNEPWFVGKDVADELGYQNGSRDINRHVDEEDRSTTTMSDGVQKRNVIIINESGLYSLILSSKLESAKRFKRWVTSEVLPSIRKHGAYMTTETIEKVLTDPDTIIQIATQLKEERAKRQQAEMVIEEQKPKVLFADSVAASNTSILVGDLAKLLKQNGVNTGQKRLFEWLRDNGFLIKRKGSDYNMPTQKSMEMELFEIKERTVANPDGSTRITRTPKVTGKGQLYFINKFLDDGEAV